jgi:hypothetical protein
MRLRYYVSGMLLVICAWATWELVSRGHVMAAGLVSMNICYWTTLLMTD